VGYKTWGGGAHLIGVRATLSNCSFTGNVAEVTVSPVNSSSVSFASLVGGGISYSNVTGIFRSATFTANRIDDNAAFLQGSTAYGAAIGGTSTLASTLTFQNCRFSSNRVDLFGNVYGGTIQAHSRTGLALGGTQFQDNYVNCTGGRATTSKNAQGGVLYYQGTSLSITGCAFSGNVLYRLHVYGTEAYAEGSCLYVVETTKAIEIRNSTFTNNVVVIEDRTQAVQATFSARGGVVYVVSSRAILIEGCTFRFNRVTITGVATTHMAHGGQNQIMTNSCMCML
jgi:hypothetical protein